MVKLETIPAIIAGFGLTLGIQHAFEADHIAAVTTQIPILFNQKNNSSNQVSQNHHYLVHFGELGTQLL